MEEENQMSRRNFLIIVGICYLVLYFILKVFIVFTQDLFMNHDVYSKSYNVGDVLVIEKSSEEVERFSNKSDSFNISMKNYFDNFEMEDQESNYEAYAYYGDDNIVKAVITMGVYDTQLHNIQNYSEDSYYFEFNHFPLYISDITRKHYLNKYHISDDVDLIKFIRERKKINCNFFTPISTIKENYFFNFVELALPPLDNITYIEGDLEGYIIKENDYKRAFILENNKLYCISFYKLDYFTDEVIEDILKTLVIEEKK